MNREADEHNWAPDELSTDEWSLFVAQGLSVELADPREDIYSLADGETIAERR